MRTRGNTPGGEPVKSGHFIQLTPHCTGCLCVGVSQKDHTLKCFVLPRRNILVLIIVEMLAVLHVNNTVDLQYIYWSATTVTEEICA